MRIPTGNGPTSGDSICTPANSNRYDVLEDGIPVAVNDIEPFLSNARGAAEIETDHLRPGSDQEHRNVSENGALTVTGRPPITKDMNFVSATDKARGDFVNGPT